MSTSLDKQTKTKNTPWTTVSDQGVRQQKPIQSKSEQVSSQE